MTDPPVDSRLAMSSGTPTVAAMTTTRAPRSGSGPDVRHPGGVHVPVAVPDPQPDRAARHRLDEEAAQLVRLHRLQLAGARPAAPPRSGPGAAAARRGWVGRVRASPRPRSRRPRRRRRRRSPASGARSRGRRQRGRRAPCRGRPRSRRTAPPARCRRIASSRRSAPGPAGRGRTGSRWVKRQRSSRRRSSSPLRMVTSPPPRCWSHRSTATSSDPYQFSCRQSPAGRWTPPTVTGHLCLLRGPWHRS